jgi:hypothetical protein
MPVKWPSAGQRREKCISLTRLKVDLRGKTIRNRDVGVGMQPSKNLWQRVAWVGACDCAISITGTVVIVVILMIARWPSCTRRTFEGILVRGVRDNNVFQLQGDNITKEITIARFTGRFRPMLDLIDEAVVVGSVGKAMIAGTSHHVHHVTARY